MYPRFSNVLTCSQNRNILLQALIDLGTAHSFVISEQEATTALEYYLKKAIEENVMGTMYLTSEHHLSSVNLYIISRSFKDVQESKASSNTFSKSQEAIEKSIEENKGSAKKQTKEVSGKRKEIHIKNHPLNMFDYYEHEAKTVTKNRKMLGTPRKLLS